MDIFSFKLKTGLRVLLLFYIFGLVIFHLIPFLGSYAVPHVDYYKLMEILNYLKNPGWFQGNHITQAMVESHTIVSPLYFYGLVYPLSLVFSPKFSLLIIGGILTVITCCLAGGRWERSSDFIRLLLITFLLVHLRITPLEGNRRSFTAFFILAALFFGNKLNYRYKIALILLACGIYPPLALLLLTYFSMRTLIYWFTGKMKLFNTVVSSGGFTLVFLAGMTPYLYSLIRPGSGSLTLLKVPIHYNIGSYSGIFESFVVGQQGALFLSPTNFTKFLIFLSLIILQRSLIERKFFFQEKYKLFLSSVLVVWGLAHLLDPLIYLPFKYTRTSLILIPALIFVDNLPSTVRRWNDVLGNWRNKLIFLYSSVTSIVFLCFVWLIDVLLWNDINFMRIKYLTAAWRRFLYALPVFLILCVLIPQVKNKINIRVAISSIILFIMIFFSHSPFNSSNSLKLKNFEGMYEFLKNTSPGTVVAGPPFHFLDSIPAFGRRSTYNSLNKFFNREICQRNRELWNIYFSETSEPILKFMKKNSIDYLLVDRQLANNPVKHDSRCVPTNLTASPEPFLARDFPAAPWSLMNQFYLVDRKTIIKLDRKSLF